MNDIDHAFARFKNEEPVPADQRKTLSIPRRKGGGGVRTVEVVHLRSRGASKDHPQRSDPRVRAASWEGGFPAKSSVVTPDLPAPASVTAITPTTYLMPAWNPGGTEEASPASGSPTAAEEFGVAERRSRGRPRKQVSSSHPTRRVADPFDAADDGTNCLRCGYAIEAVREKRGLMTCAGCE